MTGVVRVTIRYSADSAEVIRCVPIHGPAPPSVIYPGANVDGAWIEVLDAQGRSVYAQPLPDPHRGPEVLTDDCRLDRSAVADPLRYASIEMPWPGSGAKLAVHARKPRRKGLGIGLSPSLIGDFPLQPKALEPALGAAAPPQPVLRPIWGAANPNALMLAFFAEGFTATEMPTFRAVVDRCIRAFKQTAPFQRLLPAMSVAHVETISRVSGIIGTQARDTVFEGHFQEGSLGRVILIDQGIASRMLDQLFRRSAIALVVANTPQYGGSGGAATVFSCEPNWSAEIAMHELGHSLFGLADEYDAPGQAGTMKPVEPNVCGSAHRSDLKWADLVSAATPLPTQSAGHPAPPALPIGAYEGAKYQQRNVFRAAFDCKMRTPGQPFCPVCSRVIEQRLCAYQP